MNNEQKENLTKELKKKTIKPSWYIIFKKIIDPRKKNKEYENQIPKIITRYLLFKARTEITFLKKEAKKYKWSNQIYIETYISKMTEIYHKDDKDQMLKKQKEKKENESKQFNNKDILKQIEKIKEEANTPIDDSTPRVAYNRYRNVKSRYLETYYDNHSLTTGNTKKELKTPKNNQKINFTGVFTEPRMRAKKETKQTSSNESVKMKRHCTQQDLIRKYIITNEESEDEETEKSIKKEEHSIHIQSNKSIKRNKNPIIFASYLNKTDLYYS